MKYPAPFSLLRQHNILPDWTKKRHVLIAAKGKPRHSPRTTFASHGFIVAGAERATNFLLPNDYHPILIAGNGSSTTSFALEASIFLCAVAGVPQHCLSKVLGVDDKIVSTIYGNNEASCARFVLSKEKSIEHGGGKGWVDVEARRMRLIWARVFLTIWKI